MRLLSVRPGATVLLLVVTLLIARASLSNPHTPAAAQGTVPTATATPDPTVVPTAPLDVHDAQDQLGGLFSQIEGDPPPSSDVETLASRLVGIDFGQLANAIESPVGPKDLVTGIPQTPHKLVLNLFADVVLTGIVEHVEPTSSGHALWGGLEGVKLGTMTLVVNGSVVVGTVRTPDAVYTIRTAGGGAYVVRQIDESSLPPLGEPLRGSIPEPDSPPPVRPQIRGSDAPDGTSTPTSTPTPVPTVATSPSKPAPDEAMASGLFSEVEGDPPPSPGVDTLASRLVEIDFGQLSQVTKSQVGPKDPVTGKPTEPQALVLNLFDDVVLTGIVEHVEPTSSGHSLWGRLDGVGLGTFTLVVNGRMVIGTVRTPDAVYTIRTAGDGKYVIRQIDESSLPPLGEPLEPPLSPLSPLSPRDAPAEADDVPSDDGSEIDVMVVYTPLAKHREGGRAAIEALIDLFVAETNQAYVNSGVTHRIKLVLREEVDYTENGISGFDLGRLLDDSDGYMDHVHELRNLYAADLVHIVLGRSVDACGRAAGIGGDESTGFAFTVSYCGGLTFAHELGHNMGLLHDRYQLGVPLTGSNYGYVNQRMFEPGAPESARWHTIMAYGIQCGEVAGYYCEGIGYFSNPENNYNGDPMGVPADNPSTGADGPADAVKTLNERREITANFRRSSASPTPRVHLTLSPYWLAENGGVSAVTATLHRPSSVDTIVTLLASPADAVTLSGSGVLTIPAGQTVSGGTVTITGIDNNDQAGEAIVTISATAANTSSLGVVDPEPVALVIADDETTPVVTLSLSPSEIAEHEGWTFVTAMLDSRSSADTIVSVSAEPADAVEEISSDPLTIPAGQTESIGFGVSLLAVDNDELAEATQTVTVSGTSENPQGVAGPENVTLTIIDDEAPFFAADSIAYTFTAGIAGGRFLPEAAHGNGNLAYSLSLAPSNDVTFTPGPPAWVGIPSSFEAGREMSYTLTATDADGDTDTMTISITVRKGVCPNSAAVSGYSDPGIVHDCEALLASRDTLSVDQSLNWDEDLPIDEWKGVELADGRVVGLRVSYQGIVGTIPSELGSLANLTRLSLWNNFLTGGIPKELGSLANLTELLLHGNQLTGEIPPELGSLSNLTELFLFSNQLTGEIPPELGLLSNLRHLWLWSNQLTGEIPPELGGLSNLTHLYLDNNQLTGEIPPELGSLSNLEWLDIASNQLTGVIPKELGNLSNLQSLDLSDNRLTGSIAKELGNLSNLQELYLGGNLLTGCVPDGLRDVPNNDIARLGLPFCTEHPCVSGGAVVDATNTGLVSDCGMLLAARDTLAGTAALNWSADTPIADWTGVALGEASGRVTEILLVRMGLNGRIPTELGSLSNLERLWLSGNQLTGEIPPELGGLSNLTELRLWSNQLTGEIPPELGRLSNLRHLWLWSNQLTGEIPPELGGLANLRYLRLWSNQLTGEIPPELGGLANLTQLSLDNNQLTGEIPPELGGLSNLTGLSLSGNQLTGEIPPELGGLSNLTGLSLSGNQLTGEIPPELGGLSNLTGLFLHGNQLTGEIPPELGGLANLTRLWLHRNQLTGEIPPELGRLSNLTGLWLRGNQLTGEIPTELGNLSNLQQLYLGGNLLTGCVPDGLRDVPNNDIARLGLPFCTEHPCVSGGAVVDATNTGLVSDCGMLLAARDTLAGTAALNWSADTPIADWTGVALGEASGRVTEILLVRMGLNGRIPTELGSLSNLERLWLSGNQLTGEIPPELGGLSNLTGLILADNELTGEIPPELGGLSNLERLYLGGNLLTGCVPAGLRDVPNNDIASLGLPFCSEHPCVSGGAVVDATNTGLVSDCGMLLAARDTLAGTAALNWSADTPIADWTGVALGEASGRVTRILLLGMGLNGRIPTELGSLANLTHLILADNQLTGVIPTELENLSNLRWLYLGGNLLTGCVPAGLRDVPNNDIVRLGLPFCSEHPCVSGGAVVDATNTGLVSDCGMLLAARDTLAGTASLNWSADTPITEWNGVVLGGTHGHVTILKLGALGLNGRIPKELGSLANLTRLSLWGNQLTGEIPPELGRLSNLTQLILHGNQLTGEIPPELGGLSNLTLLILHGNGLTGEIPTELGGLSNLTRLFLHGNQLTGEIPPELGGLSNLTGLSLSFNELTGEIPPELGRLSNLTYLDLSRNQLTGEIPPELGGLSNLMQLILSGNQLTGEIPPELGGLSNLTYLDLSRNQLTGEIPPELGGLSNLTYLSLSGNQLTGEIPPELGGLSNLTLLSLSGNQLTGEIPPELGGLSNLTRLSLSGNQLTGEIPPELGGLSNLTRLFLDGNQLTGEIPPELGGLSNLTWLYLADNGLTGCVPAGLRDVPNNDIVRLGLPFCSEHPCVSGGAVVDATNTGLVSDCGMLLAARDTLAGTAALNWSADTPIADWTGVALGEASGRVTEILLVRMGLNGRIPTELGSLANLTELVLADNGLAGEIPPELGGLSNLERLNIASNQLTGTIPKELGRLANLTGLFLFSNQLTGEIPPELGGLSNLERLWLSGNQLTGEIPPELGGLSNLTGLILADNELAGEIPPELGGLPNLTGLVLSGNQLTGEIPPELGGLSNLTGLILHVNQLTGEIPPELGGLSNLTRLFLSGNQLTGEIPPELGGLSNLTGLWLRGNQLTGEIPPELGGLSNLTGLIAPRQPVDGRDSA